jgi:hypothetical protein
MIRRQEAQKELQGEVQEKEARQANSPAPVARQKPAHKRVAWREAYILPPAEAGPAGPDEAGDLLKS